MGDFVRLSHKRHCGCVESEEGCVLTPCAGHRDREVFQRARRTSFGTAGVADFATVVPISRKRTHPLTRFLSLLNPFRGGARR